MEGTDPGTVRSRPPDPEGVERFRRLVWWSTVGLVYAVGAGLAVAILATEPPGTAAWMGAIGTAAAAWASGRILHRRFSRLTDAAASGFPSALMAAGVVAAMATVVGAQLSSEVPTWSIAPGMVTGAVAVSVPRRRRVATVAGGAVAATLLAVGIRYLRAAEVEPAGLATNAVLIGLIAAALISSIWSWDVVARLERAGRLEAELAVADERLRFAGDLHDVQGHHLHVIALESELATRLAETDPEAARAHMQQVHEHARSALAETRDLVRGYRRTSLRAELANATRVLVAAGIDGRMGYGTEEAAGDVPEGGSHILGLVVREATTNVLRHSQAGRTRFALVLDGGRARLEVVNDGARASDLTSGSGLANLADRLDSVGGTLDWAREGEWFTVRAEVPASGERP